MGISTLTEDRRNQLLELVRIRGFASLPDLTKELGVSESTVRRDLDYWELNGAAKRTRGGAYYTGPSPKLPHFDQRQEVQWDKKRAIARRAVELIDDGSVVALDGGSTTYELARLLVDRTVQVVTNSLPVANLLMTNVNSELVLIGGSVHQKTGVTLGPYADRMLAGLNVHRAVLSVAGINEQGLFNSNLLLVETELAMMRSADEVIIVADSTKFGRRGLAHLCEIGHVDKIVVDAGIEEYWKEIVLAQGVDLVVAPKDTRPAAGTEDDGDQTSED